MVPAPKQLYQAIRLLDEAIELLQSPYLAEPTTGQRVRVEGATADLRRLAYAMIRAEAVAETTAELEAAAKAE